jgi:hypothetical protein
MIACKETIRVVKCYSIDLTIDLTIVDIRLTNIVFIKVILSTRCVIFSYPKLVSISVLTFIKWRLNTELCCKRYDFLTKKRPKTIVIRIIVLDDNIQIYSYGAFYVNTSWACALFRNNKQHVVLGQKRNCQRVEESGFWRIQRERWTEVKYLPNGTNAGYMKGISWTVGTNSRKCSRWQFLFCPRTTCCLLFLNSAHAQDVFT